MKCQDKTKQDRNSQCKNVEYTQCKHLTLIYQSSEQIILRSWVCIFSYNTEQLTLVHQIPATRVKAFRALRRVSYGDFISRIHTWLCVYSSDEIQPAIWPMSCQIYYRVTVKSVSPGSGNWVVLQWWPWTMKSLMFDMKHRSDRTHLSAEESLKKT